MARSSPKISDLSLMSQILALFRDEEVWTIDTHWMGCDAAKIRLFLDSGGIGMYADDPRVMIIEEFQQWVSLSRKKAEIKEAERRRRPRDVNHWGDGNGED